MYSVTSFWFKSFDLLLELINFRLYFGLLFLGCLEYLTIERLVQSYTFNLKIKNISSIISLYEVFKVHLTVLSVIRNLKLLKSLITGNTSYLFKQLLPLFLNKFRSHLLSHVVSNIVSSAA